MQKITLAASILKHNRLCMTLKKSHIFKNLTTLFKERTYYFCSTLDLIISERKKSIIFSKPFKVEFNFTLHRIYILKK